MHEYDHQPAPPDLMNAINCVEHGKYLRMAEGEDRERIIEAMDALGVVGEAQSQESIEHGIRDAQWLVETGNAVEALKEHRFVEDWTLRQYLENEYPTLTVDFPTDAAIPVRWDKLDCAESFDSWLGRGSEGTGEVDGMMSSRDKILDFASRDTKLPPIELLLILTPDGPLCVARNSHRAAAAILRSENIGCDALKVIDAREAIHN